MLATKVWFPTFIIELTSFTQFAHHLISFLVTDFAIIMSECFFFIIYHMSEIIDIVFFIYVFLHIMEFNNFYVILCKYRSSPTYPWMALRLHSSLGSEGKHVECGDAYIILIVFCCIFWEISQN